MTIQAELRTETLVALGVTVRRYSRSMFGTQVMSIVSARRSETLEEYWWYIEQMRTIPGADGCNPLVVDGGGDPTHEGKEAEEGTKVPVVNTKNDGSS